MKKKKILKYSLLSLALMAALVAWYIYKEYNRTHTDTSRLKPDYSLAAVSLLKEFENNKPVSNKKYWEKVIRVDGILKEIYTDEKGYCTLSLGDTASLSSVRCSIDSIHSRDAASLQKGTHIAIKGICSGYTEDDLLGSEVILVRSVIDVTYSNLNK
jgi:hypothetical protein